MKNRIRGEIEIVGKIQKGIREQEQFWLSMRKKKRNKVLCSTLEVAGTKPKHSVAVCRDDSISRAENLRFTLCIQISFKYQVPHKKELQEKRGTGVTSIDSATFCFEAVEVRSGRKKKSQA